jgi:hypothetical protein
MLDTVPYLWYTLCSWFLGVYNFNIVFTRVALSSLIVIGMLLIVIGMLLIVIGMLLVVIGMLLIVK